MQGGKLQTRLGILTLLSTWLAECPNAVAQFLKLPNAVPFLTAQVASNEHDEHETLVQSLCAFLLGLCLVFNNDSNANFTKVKMISYNLLSFFVILYQSLLLFVGIVGPARHQTHWPGDVCGQTGGSVQT